ncbi:MAG: Hsp20 family protein [Alphaproteobacteria bacterium]|nr:Hsp20 family protein [Rhizobiaceae bacterium]MBU3963017.1 Hsp20 family protein [Alphaproteobacteria bacterium]MBU4048343.1 Hsp20 family protein [Alphaproteobacteria bacterium]MBU4091069.1 Hsp20 family protein [Alphaproteobacteria bacterium]MBU4158586.1 Hsp20 family protein [Alphaproteobacteria bacterium]
MRNTKTSARPLLIGFGMGDSAAGRVNRASDGYPPFNIERLGRGETAAERLRITLAVAGFGEDELEVLVEADQLIIRGRQTERDEPIYLFRGIAARQFQRVFLLESGMDVLSATLRHGLLSIDLVRPQSAQMVRKINISAAQ